MRWQFVKQCVNLLEKASAEGLSVSGNSVSLKFGAELCWFITCQDQQQSMQFNLQQVTPNMPDTTNGPAWSGMTKEHLWHRLTGAPHLASAQYSCNSHPQLLSRSDGLKAFAQQTFDLLCTAKGMLLMVMEGLEESEDMKEGGHILCIAHDVDPKDPAKIVLHWEIDGEECIVDPPKITFAGLPEEVTAIRTHFYSDDPSPYQLPDIQGLTYFNLESQVLHDFVYKGNVDIDAWVDMQHEAANDWYEHMDDFDSDFDDMLDLDDGDMANLVGAMQG